MQYVNSYYDITVGLRYYGPLPTSTRVDRYFVFGEFGPEFSDVTRWKEPPHEYLANVPRTEEFELCDLKAMEAFVRRYGVLNARLDSWTPSASSKFEEQCVSFTRFQTILRQAWKQDAEALSEIEIQVEHALDARTSMKGGTIVLTTENLWSFICVLFMRDFQARKAKICASPDCINPYFVEHRKGQKYCSHVCAVRENVRRFRETQHQEKRRRVTTKRTRRSREDGARKTR
jgi:hypothetical protein